MGKGKEDVLETLGAVIKALGWAISILKQVVHANCTYLHSPIIAQLFSPLSLFIKEVIEVNKIFMIHRDKHPEAFIKRHMKSRGHCMEVVTLSPGQI